MVVQEPHVVFRYVNLYKLGNSEFRNYSRLAAVIIPLLFIRQVFEKVRPDGQYKIGLWNSRFSDDSSLEIHNSSSRNWDHRRGFSRCLSRHPSVLTQAPWLLGTWSSTSPAAVDVSFFVSATTIIRWRFFRWCSRAAL